MNPTELTKLLEEFRDRGAETHAEAEYPEDMAGDRSIAYLGHKSGHDALAIRLMGLVDGLVVIANAKICSDAKAEVAQETLEQFYKALEVKK